MLCYAIKESKHMKKRNLIIIICIVTCIAVASAVLTAFILSRPKQTQAATDPSEIFYYEQDPDDANAIIITGYKKDIFSELNIPAEIDNKPVTKIGNSAFANCSMTSVTIPASVTSIGNNAFDSCKNLKTITLSVNLKSIGGSAFENCDNLINITISS